MGRGCSECGSPPVAGSLEPQVWSLIPSHMTEDNAPLYTSGDQLG